MKRKFVLVLLPFLLASCSVAPVSSSSISEDLPSSSLMEGLEIKGVNHLGIREYLTLLCYYNGEEIKPSWTSSDPGVATISSTGMVKGISFGKTTITASYSGHEAIFELTVEDSWSLSNVIDKLVSHAYRIEVEASGEEYDSLSDSSFALSVYRNGFYYEAENSSFYIEDFGYGVNEGKTFQYSIKDGSIDKATYLRYPTSDFLSLFFHLGTLSSNYYNDYPLNEDNLYEIANTNIQSLYLSIASQFISASQSTFLNSLTSYAYSLNIEVTSSSSFKASLIAKDEEGQEAISYSFSVSILAEDSFAILDSYLLSSSPSYPDIYGDISSIYELSKGHNYTRDFGNYVTERGSSIHIGQAYFTSDYLYIEYTDPYIRETQETVTYQSHGYINVSGKSSLEDGVYAFTVSKNTHGDNEVVLGEREEKSDGSNYSYYYEFYENLTLILESLERDFYTFEQVSLGDSSIVGKQYASYSSTSSSFTTQLFSDYISAFGLTASGLIMAIDYNEQDPSLSSCQLGGLFSYGGSSVYEMADYPYSSFGTTSSSFIEKYIASLS